MNLRLRFVIILTTIVSVILITSDVIIFLIYSNFREQDYNNRLWSEAYSSYKRFYNITNIDKKTEEELAKYTPPNLSDRKTVLINDSGRIVYLRPDTLKYKIDTALLSKIKTQGQYYFNIGQIQGIGLYFNSPGKSCYAISTAFDRYGFLRISKLQNIMAFVGLGSIVIIGLFSFLYVINTTRPLVLLSERMRHISESNLKERVSVNREHANGNEVVQMALNFNNMLDRLDHAFEMQQTFVHHASHELRTPLASMLSQTESALKKQLDSSEAKAVLNSLKEDQQELIELTNNLLMLSQYEKISFSNDWPKLRIDEVLYESISNAQKLFPDLTINFDFSKLPENEESLSIKGNETLLRSAFRNLIKNAYLYSDNKKLNITIEALPQLINLYFENTGNTLSATEMQSVFLPFFRGANTQKKKGFGLGLSIVKRIIAIHNGIITYEVIDNKINRYKISIQLQEAV